MTSSRATRDREVAESLPDLLPQPECSESAYGMLFWAFSKIGDAAMAYIPSVTLNDVIENSKVGLWLDTMYDGAVALVCKIPENVIRALHMGAECSFLLSIVQVESLSIMCLGLKIQDEPDNPLIVMTSGSDLESVKAVLNLRITRLHCLNELNHPVLGACCSLDTVRAQDALDRLRSANLSSLTDREPAEIFRIGECALMRFQKRIYRSAGDEDELLTETIVAIPLTLEIWEAGEVFEVSPTAQGGPFRIDDDDEGNKLERQLFLSIDTIYPGSTYHQPRRGGSKNKELIDVLGFNGSSICLVESKSLSVLRVDPHRSSQRRASTVRKDVVKAMRQLRGALTKIRSGRQIYDSDGRPIVIAGQRTSLAHAIVLLSEMYFFLDWKLIAREVGYASENEYHKALFHVMDFIELNHIVNQCRDAYDFNMWMAQRWAGVKMKGTAYGRIIQLHPTSPDS